MYYDIWLDIGKLDKLIEKEKNYNNEHYGNYSKKGYK